MKIDVTFSQTAQRIPITMRGGESADLDLGFRDMVAVPSESDHRQLQHRDAADQHPIGAISNLRGELDGKLDGAGFLSNMEIQKILDA